MRFTTDELAELTGGRVHGSATEIVGATQDSRDVEPGRLFVPLIAERDGHDFIDRALAAGASAYLTSRPPSAGTAIAVDDTYEALRSIGLGARRRIVGHVIGITGSVGKTSTKDLLVSILSQSSRAHASQRSFNNEIGVPLTLINAPDDTEVAVIEMGSRGVGHIAELCAIAEPTIGLITTIAGAHTEEFGSVETIALAKGELIEALPADGLAVLNADVPLALQIATRSAAPVLTFGQSASADVRFRDIALDGDLRATFTIDSDWGSFAVTPATRGAHLVANATASAAVALWLGHSPEEVQAGLASAPLSPWRMEVVRSSGGATIINDTYNANPTSMRGALDSLAAMSARRRIAILGYMAELGDSEGVDHREIAAYAAKLGIEVIAVGTELYGLPVADDAVAAVGWLGPGDALLVKGSRSAGLESVAEAFAAS
jgi:UDP-N-acetylmuramoyl-tripeptide--D-alanyl-D-alanine ligase